MLRPILAFLTLCVAAFLLAPTVASVHEKVDGMHVERELPWQIWKWTREPEPPGLTFPDCGRKTHALYSEVTKWPERISKDENFTLSGIVNSPEEGSLGVPTIEVDLFLNETKEEPGVFLGRTTSHAGGYFELTTSLPFDLQASRYHLVAHAKERQVACTRYLEHWSDPELDIVSPTRIEWSVDGRPVVSNNVTILGFLLDVVNGPVKNASVNVTFQGKTQPLVTNEQGRFELPFRPEKAGEFPLSASYGGSEWYEPTKNETKIRVLEEDVVLADRLVFTRSTPTALAGQVYVADAARQPQVTLTFDGFRVATCPTCAATSTLEATLDDAGRFEVEVVVPPSEPAGAGTITLSGGGLKETYARNASVEVPTQLQVHGNGTGLFARGYETTAILTDEVGRPVPNAPVALLTPAGWSENATGPDGAVRLSGNAECGRSPVRAMFNGTSGMRGAQAEDELLVCSYLAFIPAWLLAVPWWAWALLALAGGLAWLVFHGWRQRFAPVIVGGPALTLTFTEPSDAAVGYAGIGEAVVATAFLEEPLPDGHRLRMGTHRATSEVPLDAELRAHLRLVPDKLGELPVRAEIVDPKGRIVSRRTLPLRVVRYAEEIEQRYLRLRGESGADDAVTPREFEAWLRERAPGLDPQLARRLVLIFEEADYSPRVAGRAEFAAYVAAERGVKEVKADALA